MTYINKDTKIFCSFAKTAGNKGCQFHNAGFESLGINAIYKSFSVNEIEPAIYAMKILNIKGAGITMPFKREVLKYITHVGKDVAEIKAVNTIINEEGILFGYNTDWQAARKYLKQAYQLNHYDTISILGNGGYASAVNYAAQKIGLDIEIITRETWDKISKLKKTIVFNCTPVENIKVDRSCYFIDCLPSTPSGAALSNLQASYQFELYTGQKYPHAIVY